MPQSKSALFTCVRRTCSAFLCLPPLLLGSALPAPAASLPSGFVESLVAGGIANPTAMEFAPDGRLFILEQGGRVRVIKDGVLLAQPFVTLSVDSRGERGLLGIAFDPNFATNRYVYLYYTVPEPNLHNRISRLSADGDVAVPGSETVIFDLEPLSGATNHNGGAIHFLGNKLLVAVGDNADTTRPQSLNTVFGKMLRLNADGTIPSDNPFYSTTSGNNRAIWALGLRNPFTFAIQPGTNKIHINDVGQNVWEEINTGRRGANYGWPTTEGPTTDPRFRSPFFAYEHFQADPVIGNACAITGGAFYNPPTPTFPTSYVGGYFFADFCGGWINLLAPNGTATRFASEVPDPVDLKVGPDGSLYYLARGNQSVYRISASQAPALVTQPTSQTVRVGETATFSVTASGSAPLSYQWQRNGSNIAGATAASYTTPSLTLSDSGVQYRAIVSNPIGNITSNPATLTVTNSQRPTATIVEPATGTLFAGGDTVAFSGTGSDPEDGSLGAAAFTWQVDYHTGSAPPRPFVLPTTGITSGTFTIPTSTPYTLPDVFYRISLKVTDSAGLTATTTRDILPRTATVRLETIPAGLTVNLDGQPVQTPGSFVGVAGITRNLSAPRSQSFEGGTYVFESWSDGGARTHDISTPAIDTTYTATFRRLP